MMLRLIAFRMSTIQASGFDMLKTHGATPSLTS
jgi:hypothetical protein